ncbi:hypothetical protein BDV29DRAFT_179262 [Aspergillus leporis]|uniref:Uncharacterized protein n=1 Tax=Aspergillus leporis TaxID=41062 RepID=A0A5N5WUK7_9EURO|nr:hypothetical protein BDV29DRAFT_179262 [Aspergillus leporis]
MQLAPCPFQKAENIVYSITYDANTLHCGEMAHSEWKFKGLKDTLSLFHIPHPSETQQYDLLLIVDATISMQGFLSSLNTSLRQIIHFSADPVLLAH